MDQQEKYHYKLTDKQIQNFEQDGFLVIKDFVTKDQIQKLRCRIQEIIDKGFDLNKHAASVFSTEKDDRHVQDKYFLDSAENISFFLEKLAFDANTKQLKQGIDKKNALNKIGHALHYDDSVFRDFSWQQSFADMSKQLLNYSSPTMAQSMYIFKPPKLGAKVTPHQDSTFLYMTKKPCIGFWFALEDATQENGCLWAWPGSHKLGLKNKWSRTIEEDKETGEKLVKMKFIPQPSAQDLDTLDKEDCNQEKYVPVEVPAGSLVVLHGQMVHKSYDNLSDKGREAFTLHCIDLDAEYPQDNWLIRKDNFPTFWHK